jgi:hypothetical protein
VRIILSSFSYATPVPAPSCSWVGSWTQRNDCVPQVRDRPSATSPNPLIWVKTLFRTSCRLERHK